MPPEEIKELLTRKEVERILKISRSQIYNLLKTGRLKAYKIGGTLRFQKDDVNLLIESHSYIKGKAIKIAETSEEGKVPAQETKARSEIKKGTKATLGDSFDEAVKLSENVDLLIDQEEKKYKIGDLLVLDFKDFGNENPHIIATKLKRHFGEALQSKFSLSPEEVKKILDLMESKFKEFGRRVFIRAMQMNNQTSNSNNQINTNNQINSNTQIPNSKQYPNSNTQNYK